MKEVMDLRGAIDKLEATTKATKEEERAKRKAAKDGTAATKNG